MSDRELEEGLDEDLETRGDEELDGGLDDFSSLSDEEFLNHTPGSPAGASQDAAEDGVGEGEEEDPNTQPEADTAKPEEGGDQPADAGAAAGEAGHTTPNQTGAEEPAKDPAKAEGSDAAPDYEALYKRMMAPFKANGKEFTPSSPEELIRLAQMGTNYTKKMQALAPNLQLMRMLENNGLLEESKLSHLIDISKGNPAAIQKLLHDTKVDPLDLDTSAEPNYTPGNHRVSEEEMRFREVMDDVTSTDTGKETIVHLNSTWDQASKTVLFKEPHLLPIINEHRSNGVYARITSEIERQRTLGYLSGIPFIEAYKVVGSQLQAAGLLNQAPASAGSPGTGANPGTVPVPRQVLETRAAKPRQVVSNGDRAKAASPGPKAPSKAAPRTFDPFSMTDEEIMAIATPPSR